MPSSYTIYYRDPVANNYVKDQKPNKGSFTIKNVDHKDLKDPRLSFLLYMDTETGNETDTLKVHADDKVFWEKDEKNVYMKDWQSLQGKPFG